ncbi:MAG: hypothetical protein J3K34DRAFT_128990 [Monoraphidium minutum]|nr:MAG: hypothetical protein J3K34DRAFT_128990 [Monoraphidium minutum]
MLPRLPAGLPTSVGVTSFLSDGGGRGRTRRQARTVAGPPQAGAARRPPPDATTRARACGGGPRAACGRRASQPAGGGCTPRAGGCGRGGATCWLRQVAFSGQAGRQEGVWGACARRPAGFGRSPMMNSKAPRRQPARPPGDTGHEAACAAPPGRGPRCERCIAAGQPGKSTHGCRPLCRRDRAANLGESQQEVRPSRCSRGRPGCLGARAAAPVAKGARWR